MRSDGQNSLTRVVAETAEQNWLQKRDASHGALNITEPRVYGALPASRERSPGNVTHRFLGRGFFWPLNRAYVIRSVLEAFSCRIPYSNWRSSARICCFRSLDWATSAPAQSLPRRAAVATRAAIATLRLTYKEGGKTVTESFATLGMQRKAERDLAEFRRFQELSRAFLEVNARICRERPKRSSAKRHGKCRPAGCHLHKLAQERSIRSGGSRNGHPRRLPPTRREGAVTEQPAQLDRPSR